MKKILFPIVFSIIVLLLTGMAVYAGPVEDQKKAHIMQSFDIVAQEFYQRAERYQGPAEMLLVIADETDPKEHYYLGMIVDSSGIIKMVYASVQIELANDVVEIRNEGLVVDYEIRDYKHYSDRKLVFRNENCRTEKMEPVEGVWDTVLGKLFLNNAPE